MNHQLHHHHLSSTELLELMESKRYGAEYQPIVSVKSKEIVAYEALSRFYDPANRAIRPDLVYASLHDNPLSLFQVEYAQKKLQLSYAPNHSDLFVNLDQDSFSAAGSIKSDNPFITLLRNYSKANVVVELIENSQLSDALMSLAMINNLTKNNVSTAIDDLFNPQSMLSTSVVQLVDYIKFDKYVIGNKCSSNFMALVHFMINYAKDTGKKIILEGVETEQDLAFAESIGVDFVQGFFFKKLFKNVS